MIALICTQWPHTCICAYVVYVCLLVCTSSVVYSVFVLFGVFRCIHAFALCINTHVD